MNKFQVSAPKIKLAIVIPAYKTTFFEEAVNSVLNQSNQSFNLYICIDGPVKEFEPILEKYTGRKNISIIRFQDNLGGKDLVAQWERCLEQTGNEDFIWVFPDDDVMSPNCVESFYNFIGSANSKTNVLRFNNYFINSRGEQISKKQFLPEKETSREYIENRLNLRRFSSLAEHIFSRKIYEKTGGFVNFPAAWFADDATWIKFSMDSSILTIPEGTVYVRQSDENISNSRTGFQKQKIKATYMYLDFIQSNDLIKGLANREKVLTRFILDQYVGTNFQPSWKQILHYGLRNQALTRAGYLRNFYRLFLHNHRMKKMHSNEQ